MTKHEVKTLDSVLIGPAMLILNQYFNTFLSEYFVLWLALVSITHSDSPCFLNPDTYTFANLSPVCVSTLSVLRVHSSLISIVSLFAFKLNF